MADKHPKLDLAAAMRNDLEAHDPLGPRLSPTTRPDALVSSSQATSEPLSSDPLGHLSHETVVHSSQSPLGSSTQRTVGLSADVTMGRTEHATLVATSHETERTDLQRRTAVAPSRQGMSRISGYFSPRVLKQMRLLAATQDCTVDELVGRALNMLFVAEGLPAIAFDDKDRTRAALRQET